MKRYTRTLGDHLKIFEEHARYKVDALLKLAKRAKKIQVKQQLKDTDPLTPELEKIYLAMVAVTEELKPVEHWIKANWPEITELYDAVQKAKAPQDEN